MAANNGHFPVVQLLVQEGADMNAPTEVKGGRGGVLGAKLCCWFLAGSCSKAGDFQHFDKGRTMMKLSWTRTLRLPFAPEARQKISRKLAP